MRRHSPIYLAEEKLALPAGGWKHPANMRALVYFVLLFNCVLGTLVHAVEPERLFYLSNGEVLQGMVYKPAGKGPFPAVIHNQSTAKDWAKESNAKLFTELGNFYTSHGYVLFLPGRRRWKTDEASESTAATNTVDTVEENRKVVEDHQRQGEVVFSALATLKAQAYVNSRKVFISGHGAGGATALMMAGKDIDVRGYVLFSPAAASWSKNLLLQHALKRAVRNANAPVFLIQTENDQSVVPAQVLGKELEKKGPPNRAKIYPPCGTTLRDAVFFNLNGTKTWGEDVLSFLKAAGK